MTALTVENFDAVLSQSSVFRGLATKVEKLGTEVHRIGLCLEQVDKKIDLVIEVLQTTVKKGELIDQHTETLRDHELRLRTIESIQRP